MAHIEKRPDRHKPWWVRYRDPTGRERSRSFARKADADRFMATVRAELIRYCLEAARTKESTMAHIRKKGTKRWQVRYRDPAGKERARSFRRRTDAEHFLVPIEAEEVRESRTDPHLARTTVQDWLPTRQASRVHLRCPLLRRLLVSGRNCSLWRMVDEASRARPHQDV